MKNINFNYAGGFLLEQEGLDMLQQAYLEDFFEFFQNYLGIEKNKDYLFFDSTSDTGGWCFDGHSLIPIAPAGDFIGNAILYSTIQDALEFGSGYLEMVYTRMEGTQDYSEPGGFVMLPQPMYGEEQTITWRFFFKEDLASLTHLPHLADQFVHRDGSRAMTGDLDLNGNQISALDTQEQAEAVLRSEKLYLGHSQNPKAGGNPTGVALEDQTDILAFNPQRDWETIVVGGALQLDQADEVVGTDQHPVLIDAQGYLTQRVAPYTHESGIPIGLIMLWNEEEVPEGWVLCDGSETGTFQGMAVPDLSDHFIQSTRYIFYTANHSSNIPTEITVDQEVLEFTLGTEDAVITLRSDVRETYGVVEDVWRYTTVPEGLICELSRDVGAEITVSGFTESGDYIFSYLALDPEGRTHYGEQLVKVIVNHPPVITGIHNSVEDETTTTLTNGLFEMTITTEEVPSEVIFSIVATDAEGSTEELTYEWRDVRGDILPPPDDNPENQHQYKLLPTGFYNYEYTVVVKDKDGNMSEQDVYVKLRET